MKYYVYLKSVNEKEMYFVDSNGNIKTVTCHEYISVDLGNLVHNGDVISLGGEQFVVISGQCLPRRESVA